MLSVIGCALHKNWPSVCGFRKVKDKLCVLFALFFSSFTHDCAVRLLSKLKILSSLGLHPAFEEIVFLFFNVSLHKKGLWEDITARHTHSAYWQACVCK